MTQTEQAAAKAEKANSRAIKVRAIDCQTLPPLVTEAKRNLTGKRLDMLEAAYNAWWKAAHGDDEKAYHNARMALHTLVAEYLPELIQIAREALRWKDKTGRTARRVSEKA